MPLEDLEELGYMVTRGPKKWCRRWGPCTGLVNSGDSPWKVRGRDRREARNHKKIYDKLEQAQYLLR